MDWTRQGGAVVSPVCLTDGRTARAVLVAGRENPKGAVLVVAGAPKEQNAFPVSQLLDALQPADAVDILCAQERIFGATALEAPDFL